MTSSPPHTDADRAASELPAISSDELAPSQWLDRMSPAVTDVPELRLFIAVLADSVRCLQTGTAKERTDVVAWIRAGHGPARLSFGAMCDGLGLEMKPLATRLLATSGPALRRLRRVRARTEKKIVHVANAALEVAPTRPRCHETAHANPS